ncbi:MAG: HlyC/CorC family transporter [SAR86 cluster bacterium]|uniref:HlyC/CorC family transporter n=1 Tax=SAR86 cluster bacterium TaxID=2030880 RepID=A0A937HZS7_9GAMM|nr:HlyC/CorC family transporter [SAR86 cluster bacterium]
MTEVNPWMLLSSIVFLLFLSAFFSGVETAMMSLNRYRLKHLVKENDKGAIRADKLLKRPDRLLGVILIGNNFVNILAASLTTVLCLNLFGDSGVVIGSIVLTLIILVFAEITPKTFAALNSEKVALPASLILKYLQKILRPLVLFVNFFSNFFMRLLGTKETSINEDLSPEELKSVLENSGDLIPKKYQDMLISVLELDKVSVDEVMTQRSEVIGIDINQPIENILNNLQNNQKDFLPVYDESLDELRGVIDLYGITSFLSNEDKSIESLIESLDEAYFIPENTPLSTQLFNFQKNKKTVAVIIDEYGSVKGLVTIKDVLEEIVGELATDIDRETVEIMEQKDGSYLIDASIPLRELNKKLNWQLPINGAKTLNGLIIDQVETIPENNIKMEIDNYVIETVLIRNNMIKIARVLQIEQEDEEPSDD